MSPKLMRLMFDDSASPISAQYSDIRGRQLEGSFPGNPQLGVWSSSIARVCCGWGMVFENDWPECDDVSLWPPPEPPDIDEKAKTLQSLYYHRVRDLQDCLLTLGLGRAVNASFEITKEWYDSAEGIIRLPPAESPIVGSHAINIDGVDFGLMCFLFTNSWGADWGQSGRGMMSFSFGLRSSPCI